MTSAWDGPNGLSPDDINFDPAPGSDILDTGTTASGNVNFKGKYQLTVDSTYGRSNNNAIMLTINNEMQFLGDIIISNYEEGKTFATLPEDCRPKDLCKIPCVYGNMIAILDIEPEGDLQLYAPNGHTIDKKGILYISGTSFNISDRWYV